MPARFAAAPVVAALGALVAWAGLVLQFVLSLSLSLDRGLSVSEGIALYFGYFTILTNLLVALFLTSAVLAPSTTARRVFARPAVATALASAIVFVAIGYILLLREAWDPEGYLLVADTALHYATPLLFLLYWWLAIPKSTLRWSALATSLTYPLAYLAYVLLRGELTGFYPYPFLDVARLGYGPMLLNVSALAAGYLLVATVLVAGGRAQARSKRRL